MAYASFGGAGAVPALGGNQASGSTYFPQGGQLPDYIQQLLSVLGPEASTAGNQYNNYISNPTASPLYQNSLNGLLAALQPSEDKAMTNLADTFRSAGNLASGAFGTAGANLQSDILRNRQTLASQLLSQQFPQMTSALMAPQSQLTSLMNALKLSQQFGAPQMSGSASAGGISDPFGTLSAGNIDFNNPFSNSAVRPYTGESGTTAATGVNAPPAAPGAPTPQNPWSQLEALLGGGGGGGGNDITQNGPYSWTNYQNPNQFQPWTGSLLTAPQFDVPNGGEY